MGAAASVNQYGEGEEEAKGGAGDSSASLSSTTHTPRPSDTHTDRQDHSSGTDNGAADKMASAPEKERRVSGATGAGDVVRQQEGGGGNGAKTRRDADQRPVLVAEKKGSVTHTQSDLEILEAKRHARLANPQRASPVPTHPQMSSETEAHNSVRALAAQNSMRKMGSALLTRDEVNAIMEGGSTEGGGSFKLSRAQSYRPKIKAREIQKIMEVDEKDWVESPVHRPTGKERQQQSKSVCDSGDEEDEEVAEYFENDEGRPGRKMSCSSATSDGSEAKPIPRLGSGGSSSQSSYRSLTSSAPPSAHKNVSDKDARRPKAVSFERSSDQPKCITPPPIAHIIAHTHTDVYTPEVAPLPSPTPIAEPSKKPGMKGGFKPKLNVEVSVAAVTPNPATAKTQKAGANAPPTGAGQGKMGMLMGLKVATGFDEDDWIQVDDQDDNMGDMSPRSKKAGLSAHEAGGDEAKAGASYVFSKSGRITVDGFDRTIGEGGIMPAEGEDGHGDELGASRGSRIPFRDRLVFLTRLGQGCSGIVYKCFDLLDLRLVALKVIPVFEQSKRRQMAKELSILYQNLKQSPRMQAQLGQPQNVENKPTGEEKSAGSAHYVVAFYDAFANKEDATVSLMVEYMDGGSLQDIADTGGCRHEETLANIAYQSLLGLQFIHSCRQIHRDLKPANMLINRRGEVKVSDFGIVRQMGDDDNDDVANEIQSFQRSAAAGVHMGEKAHTFVGTVTYMSPERIQGGDYSYSSDVWSLGLSLMTVALGKLPISTKAGYWSILQCVRDEDAPKLPPGHWSDVFRDFLGRSLTKDPLKRPDCAELLNHPFLQKARADHDSGKLNAGPINEHYHNEREDESLTELDGILSAVKDHLLTIKKSRLAALLAKEGAEMKSEALPHVAEIMRLILLARGPSALGEFAAQLQLPVSTICAEVDAYARAMDNNSGNVVVGCVSCVGVSVASVQ